MRRGVKLDGTMGAVYHFGSRALVAIKMNPARGGRPSLQCTKIDADLDYVASTAEIILIIENYPF